MLRYIDSPESTSYYSIAYSVFSGIIVVPMVIFQKSIIPKLFLEFNVDKTLVWKKITLYAKYLIPIGIIINILSLVFIDDFIKILFGMKYVKVVDIFYYLSFNIPIVLTSLCFGSYLFFEDKLMQKKLYIMGAAAFINLVLNLLLIPYFSYYGALVSTILSNVFILVSYMLVYWYEILENFKKIYRKLIAFNNIIYHYLRFYKYSGTNFEKINGYNFEILKVAHALEKSIFMPEQRDESGWENAKFYLIFSISVRLKKRK